MALKRFTSRRGAPKKIITDNGSTFIGARNEFLRIQALLEETVEGKRQTLDRSRNGMGYDSPSSTTLRWYMGSRCKEYEETSETNPRTSNFEI